MMRAASMILNLVEVQTQHQREMAGKITKTFCMVEAMRSLLRYLLLVQALFQREMPHQIPLQREAATTLMERYALGLVVTTASARIMALLNGNERTE